MEGEVEDELVVALWGEEVGAEGGERVRKVAGDREEAGAEEVHWCWFLGDLLGVGWIRCGER